MFASFLCRDPCEYQDKPPQQEQLVTRGLSKTHTEEKKGVFWIKDLTVHEKHRCFLLLLCATEEPQWNSLLCSVV